MSANDENDALLVQRYLQGEDNAFRILYTRYRPRITGYCFRLLLDHDRAEEIAQSVFAKASESLRTLRKPESLHSWLLTIARNEVYGLLRERRSNGTVELSEDVWDEETPHDVVVRDEISQLVNDNVERLKVEYREVLILREFEGLSYAAIAEVTGHTISSVESRLFKARRALLKELTSYFPARDRP